GADVLELSLPKRRGEIVLGRKITGRIEQHDANQRLELLLDDARRDVHLANAGSVEVIGDDVEGMRRLPDRASPMYEGIGRQLPSEAAAVAKRFHRRLEGDVQLAVGLGVLPAVLTHARQEPIDAAEDLGGARDDGIVVREVGLFGLDVVELLQADVEATKL